MYCKFCGKENNDGVKFCKHCGKEIAAKDAKKDAAKDTAASETEKKDAKKGAAKDAAASEAKKKAESKAESKVDSKAESKVDPKAENKVDTKAESKADNKASKKAKKKGDKKSLMDKWKALPEKTRKKIIIWSSIGLAGLIAIIVAIILVFMLLHSDTESRLRMAYEESGVLDEGVISQDYTRHTHYGLEEFKYISKENKGDDVVYKYSSIIANESFRSEIEGEVTYHPKSETMDEFKVSSKHTTPLKGVDYLQKTEAGDREVKKGGSNVGNGIMLTSGYDGYYEKTTTSRNVTSTFNEKDGRYTSDATGEKVIKYWFTDDVADCKQSFSFDNYSGWSTSGQENLSNKRSEYKLSGKNFKFTKDDSGEKNYTLTLGDVNNGKMNVNYSLSYIPTKKATFGSDVWADVNHSGTINGTFTHEWGDYKFSIEGKDSSNSEISFNIIYAAAKDSMSSATKDSNGETEPSPICLTVGFQTDLKYYYNSKHPSSGLKLSDAGIHYELTN